MNPPIEFGPKIELDYDATELEREYLAGLDVFERRIPVYDGFKLLPGEDLAAFHEACGRARERVGSPFTLMIAGDFKRGKSTLVNALAGCAAVTVDVRPETISINRIEYAADHAVHLVAEDGRKAELLPADLKRERLEEILAHLPARLRHIHIGIPAPWLRDITLVDTPGLGDLFAEFEDLVSAYLERADAVIHVSSALSPISQSEQAYLAAAVAPRLLPKIVFAVNMIDRIDDASDAGRVLESVRAKLGGQFPGSPVFGISASEEFRRVTGERSAQPDRAEEFAAAFAGFRADLRESILVRRQALTLGQGIQVERRGLESLSRRVDMLRTNLAANRGKLEATVAGLEAAGQSGAKRNSAASDALAGNIGELERQTANWMQEFWNRLQTATVTEAAHLAPDLVRKHFPFFLADRVREALDACFAEQRPRLLAAAEQTSADLRRHAEALASAKSHETPGVAAIELPWTKFHSAELVAESVGLGKLAGVGLSLIGKHKQHTMAAGMAQSIRMEMTAGWAGLRESIAALYRGITGELLARVREQHEKELAAIVSEMSRALALRDEGESEGRSHERHLQELSAALMARVEALNALIHKTNAS